MSKAGREPSRADARSFTMIEEIASAYLIEADGDLPVALQRAIGDALAALVDMEVRAHRAEWLISRGFVRGRSVVTRVADQGSTAVSPIGDGASAATRKALFAPHASPFVVGRTSERASPSVRCWESVPSASQTHPLDHSRPDDARTEAGAKPPRQHLHYVPSITPERQMALVAEARAARLREHGPQRAKSEREGSAKEQR
jgi:hypothetical protein